MHHELSGFQPAPTIYLPPMSALSSLNRQEEYVERSCSLHWFYQAGDLEAKILGTSFSFTLPYNQPTDPSWLNIKAAQVVQRMNWECSLLIASRGLPTRPVEGTRSFFLPQQSPTAQNDCSVPQRDLDLTLYWCHWCQNWASVYKQIQSSLLLCHNGSRLFSVFMPAKRFPVGPECSPGIGDKPPLNAFRNVFLGIRPRSQRNFLLVKS